MIWGAQNQEWKTTVLIDPNVPPSDVLVRNGHWSDIAKAELSLNSFEKKKNQFCNTKACAKFVNKINQED